MFPIELNQGDPARPLLSLSDRIQESYPRDAIGDQDMPSHSEIVPAVPTIIVVDDDTAVRNSLKFSLEVEGFVVRIYSAAQELLADPLIIESGCLVIDYRLREMNGLDLLTELRRREVTLPAILITTQPSEAVRARAATAGVPLVEKPLLDGSLLQAIQTILPGSKRQ